MSAYHLAFATDGALYVSGPTISSNEAIHRIDASAVRKRAHARRCVRSWSDFQLLGRGDELVDERLVDFFVHEEARRRDTDLSGIAELVC